MVYIVTLWLPILVSSAFVFVLSSLVHMVFKYHAGDYTKFPDEGRAADALRNLNLPAGQYFYPIAANSKDMKSPEFLEKMKKGPQVILTIHPGGKMSMGTNLVQWFVFTIVVGIFAAYVAGRALGPGAEYLAVFRFAGVTAFACYAVGGFSETIWFRRPWSMTLRNTFDGLLYAAVTAGTFGWLWPR